MKAIKPKHLLIYSAIAVSTVSLPVIAQTNPAGTPNSAQGSADNPATAAGQTSIRNENAQAAGVTDPSNPTPNTPPPAVSNDSVVEATQDCPLQEPAAESLKQAIEMTTDIKPDIDGMFNDKTEAAKGCFAASSEVINIAMEIPSMNMSWDVVTKAVKKQIEQFILKKSEELLEKGCRIADQALIGALEPVMEHMDKYRQNVGAFNGLMGNIGAAGVGGENVTAGSIYDDVYGMMAGRVEGSRNNIENLGNEALTKSSQITQKYGSGIATPSFNPNSTATSPVNTPMPPNTSGTEVVSRVVPAPPSVAATPSNSSGSNPYAQSSSSDSSSYNPF